MARGHGMEEKVEQRRQLLEGFRFYSQCHRSSNRQRRYPSLALGVVGTRFLRRWPLLFAVISSFPLIPVLFAVLLYRFQIKIWGGAKHVAKGVSAPLT